tara:strand:+ start:1783 stop:2424 length:642 start_codon:yes stop_codon:yes gene_type:complete
VLHHPTEGHHSLFHNILGEDPTKKFTKIEIEVFLTVIFSAYGKSFSGRFLNIVPIFGYGIPKFENLNGLSEKITELDISNIISVGSGCGFFELLLANLNQVKIDASDLVPPSILHYPTKNFTAKEHIDTTENKQTSLMFNWPPVEDWVIEAVKHYKESGFTGYTIFVGGLYDGCCWSDELEEEMNEYWEKVYEEFYDTFQGIDVEYMRIYKLK